MVSTGFNVSTAFDLSQPHHGTLNRSKGIMVVASRLSAKATGNQWSRSAAVAIRYCSAYGCAAGIAGKECGDATAAFFCGAVAVDVDVEADDSDDASVFNVAASPPSAPCWTLPSAAPAATPALTRALPLVAAAPPPRRRPIILTDEDEDEDAAAPAPLALLPPFTLLA
jgi:hypothetical protein